jgi:NitT/TauT family transport system permease protein
MTVTATRAEATALGEGKRPGTRRDQPHRLVIYAARLGVVVLVLGLWQLGASQGWFDKTTFGQPSGIWHEIVHYLPSSHARDSLQATMLAVFYTFVIGSALGTAFGLMLGLSKTLNDILGPFLAPINSIPRIALAPLFIAWFGLTIKAKIVLGVSIVFFILAENARSSVRSVDPDLMTMARVVGLRRVALIWKVVLPSAVPTIFAGLRLAFTYSLLGVIASEMIAASNGVGQDIVLYSSSFKINTVFAILFELMVIAIVVNWLFTLSERRLLVWQKT